jgi:aryl-alcohol dehydrogenase-like predicted oxidoreductase
MGGGQAVNSLVDGRTFSSVGIGTYLGACDEDTDRRMERCLTQALAHGINVIDTAPNYRAERSEEAVGKVLACLWSQGVGRARTVVATKVGFLPYHREVPADRDAFLRRRFLDSGLLLPEYIHGEWQSFHPEYIRWQLAESLARLQCEYVDIYYLHNPEALLLHHSPEEVERIVRQALEAIAGLRQRDLVRYVGVATWHGLIGRQRPDRLSLADMVRWAADAGLADYFRFVQLPLNLGMPEAVTARTQTYEGQEWSAVRLARRLGLHVITSAPLLQGKLLRLVLPQGLVATFPQAATPAQVCLEFARSAPGVTTTLVGVTTDRHLEDALQVASRPRVDPTEYAGTFS